MVVALASLGSARRTRCTGSSLIARPCTPTTAVPASCLCGAVRCAWSARPASAVASTMARWAGPAVAPGGRVVALGWQRRGQAGQLSAGHIVGDGGGGDVDDAGDFPLGAAVLEI